MDLALAKDLIAVGAVLVTIGGVYWQVKNNTKRIEQIEKMVEECKANMYRELYKSPGETVYLTDRQHTKICAPFRDELSDNLDDFTTKLEEIVKSLNDLARGFAVLSVEVQHKASKREQ